MRRARAAAPIDDETPSDMLMGAGGVTLAAAEAGMVAAADDGRSKKKKKSKGEKSRPVEAEVAEVPLDEAPPDDGRSKKKKSKAEKTSKASMGGADDAPISKADMSKGPRIGGLDEAFDSAPMSKSAAGPPRASAQKNDDAFKAALKLGSKPWHNARLMLVGEGRAGKTAVANSIVGNGYQDTHSTVGINQTSCSVQYADRSSGTVSWEVSARPEKAYEAALAAIMAGKAAEQPPEPAGNITASMAQDRVKRGINLEGAADADDESASASPQASNIRPPSAPDNTGEEAAAVTVDTKVDEDMVMKLLGESKLKSTDITLTLFDYGGQSVFNVIHHLFLTPSGVYVLVFNMETLLADEEERQRSLSYMRFWLNSIIIHAFDHTTGAVAPIVIVGTRKDKIPDPEKHVEISTRIYESFKDCRAWPSIVSNKSGASNRAKTLLYFFPVDNTLHRNDPMMAEMMTEVEEKLKISRYTNKPIPLSWFKCLDAITATKKACLPLSEIQQLARVAGLANDEEVHCFLYFLCEMGTLMWHDEPSLRDVVILDPVEYLINPATIVICKHSPDGTDPTSHQMAVHKECQNKCFQDWPLFLESGIITEKMLDILWKEFPMEHQTMLKALCQKFGLFVPLHDGAVDAEKKYQVPALLKRCPEHVIKSNAISASANLNTFFLIFSPFSNMDKLCRVITEDDLRKYSFLPSGLFERIIGKAIVWSQTTSSSNYDVHDATLYQDFAILQFGSISFSLRLMADAGCIRVDVDSVSPRVVEARLTEIVQQVLNESMKSLSCYSTVFYSPNRMPGDTDYEAYFNGSTPDSYFIPLGVISNIIDKQGALTIKKVNRILSEAEAKERFGIWLPDAVSDSYDVFISHRWNAEDDIVVAGLYESFSNYTVAALGNKQLQVFLDKRCLRAGEEFDKAFAKALCSSTVVAAVISVNALERMVNHDPSKVDNVLLEWILALACCNAAESRVRAVFPILIGECEYSGDMICSSVGNLFASKVFNSLSTEVPAATLQFAVSLLGENGIPIANMDTFRSRSLVSIVNELTKFLGCLTWNSPPHRFIGSAANEATTVLNNKMNEAGVANGGAGGDGKQEAWQAAWDMVQGGGIAQNQEALLAFLNEVGADDVSSFEDLVGDAELYEKFNALLKPLKRKKLAECLEPALAN